MSLRLLVVAGLLVLAALPAGSKTAPPSAAPGIELAAMDRSVAPGDDFYSFVNGAWLKATAGTAVAPQWQQPGRGWRNRSAQRPGPVVPSPAASS